MNYRHHFHAGNFADVMKHAVLLALIRAMGRPRVVETHAGAGLYDLMGEAATRSGEAEGGVGRLMAAGDPLPPGLEALRALVRAENQDGQLRLYPGSPRVALSALGRGASYVGHELRADDHASLRTLLAPTPGARAVLADGYAALAGEVRRGDLVLIDPPYEAGDDYDRAAEAVAACRARGAAAAVWVPLKDLEALDSFIRRLEALSPARLILAEVRLRPLTNPMKMNGSAMLLVDTPDVTAEADAICRWVAQACGEAGARGEANLLAP